MSSNVQVKYTAGHLYKSKQNNGKQGFIYKNSVETQGKCSMILPIPTSDPTSVEVIDTSDYALMMNEFYDKNRPYAGSRSIGIPITVGMYTLIVGRKIQDIHARLGVKISKNLSKWLSNHYPEGVFTFVTCIWEGDMNAQPIQIEYTPTWNDYLFFPMMEAHGDSPTEGSTIRNHYLTVSTGEASPERFMYAPPSLYDNYSGIVLNNMALPNGDLYLHIEALETIWDSDLTNINFVATP